MTTTSMYSGLQGDKSTSRVLQPPGGGSSNIFGTEPAQNTGPARASAPPSNDIFGLPTPTKLPNKPKENTATNIFGNQEDDESPSRKNTEVKEEEVADTAPAPAPALPVDDGRSPAEIARDLAWRMRQGAGNPIIGGGEEPAPVMRVRQPPGGASTKLW